MNREPWKAFRETHRDTKSYNCRALLRYSCTTELDTPFKSKLTETFACKNLNWEKLSRFSSSRDLLYFGCSGHCQCGPRGRFRKRKHQQVCLSKKSYSQPEDYRRSQDPHSSLRFAHALHISISMLTVYCCSKLEKIGHFK